MRAYTAGSAYAAVLDDRVGTLEVGKAADLVVLSQDLFSVPPECDLGHPRRHDDGRRAVVYRDDAAGPAPAVVADLRHRLRPRRPS